MERGNTVGGIMNIRGRPYATVAHRAAQAHGEHIRPSGIASTVTRFVTLGDYHIIVVTVQFTDGRTFEGSSEVTRGSGGGAQATSPVETAETSAYGRALAMAGYYGSGDGLAGYEEVTGSESRATVRAVQPRTVTTGVNGAVTTANDEF
jgi:hypothetical protein